MMNYKELTGAQLLEELSYMDQLGFAGEVQALDIREELQRRKEAAAAPTIKRDRNYKASAPRQHYKGKKVITQYGSAAYESIPTDLMEMEFTFSSYPDAIATVVYDKNNHIKKIVTSGKGCRSYTQAIKNMATRYFNQHQ